MSKKVLVLLFFALFLAAGGLRAQAPGFLGRRNIVRGDAYFFPSLRSDPWSVSKKTGFHLNNHFGIGLGRVTSRRTVVSVLADLTRGGDDDYSNNQDGRIVYTALGTGLELRWHPFMKRGWIAPLGPYAALTFRAMIINETFVPDASGRTFSYGSHIGGSTALTIGYTYVIKSRILLSTGIRFAFTDYYQFLNNGYRSSGFLYNSDFLKLHAGLGVLLGK